MLAEAVGYQLGPGIALGLPNWATDLEFDWIQISPLTTSWQL